jgi:hypothetical protein
VSTSIVVLLHFPLLCSSVHVGIERISLAVEKVLLELLSANDVAGSGVDSSDVEIVCGTIPVGIVAVIVVETIVAEKG